MVLADREMSFPLPTALPPLNAIRSGCGVELALTSFSVCAPLLPLAMVRPSDVTVSGLAPTTIFMPT